MEQTTKKGRQQNALLENSSYKDHKIQKYGEYEQPDQNMNKNPKKGSKYKHKIKAN